MTIAAPAPTRTRAARPGSSGQVEVIAHGSPDPRHRQSVSRLCTQLKALTGLPARAAYLEHDHPAATDVLSVPAPPNTPTIVIPLLLTAGFHWHSDIPPVVAHAGCRSVLLAPPEPLLFRSAVAELVGAAGHVVLASAGSSRPEIVTRFAALADALGTPQRTVDVCLTPAAVADTATPQSTVVPFLTADGLFADRVRRAAHAARASVTPVLGDTDGFAQTLADLVMAHSLSLSLTLDDGATSRGSA